MLMDFILLPQSITMFVVARAQALGYSALAITDEVRSLAWCGRVTRVRFPNTPLYGEFVTKTRQISSFGLLRAGGGGRVSCFSNKPVRSLLDRSYAVPKHPTVTLKEKQNEKC